MLDHYNKGIFSFSRNFLKVIFPISNVGKNVSKNVGKASIIQKQIIDLVCNNPHITQKEIGIIINQTTRNVQRNIKKCRKII